MLLLSHHVEVLNHIIIFLCHIYKQMTCQLLGVILEERSPEELQVCKQIYFLDSPFFPVRLKKNFFLLYLQKQATVRSSVLEVILEISKTCDIYLMERVLDDESEVCTWVPLKQSGSYNLGYLTFEYHKATLL